MLDASKTSGLLVLAGPSPSLSSGEHFHFFALTREVKKVIPALEAEQIKGRIFSSSLKSPWSILPLMGQDSYAYFMADAGDRYAAVIRACARYWELFVSVGERYTTGTSYGKNFWPTAHILPYALANSGTPKESLTCGQEQAKEVVQQWVTAHPVASDTAAG
jgi:hypothetical protein